MLATLFVDASYDANMVCSGWGAWVKTERMKLGEAYGGFTTDPLVKGSTQAEQWGVLSAISDGLEQGRIFSGDTVLVQCDCMSVGHMLEGVGFIESTFGDETKRWLYQLLRENRLSVKYKHVEGHKNPLANTRWGVNDMVDRLARRNLKKARIATLRSKLV